LVFSGSHWEGERGARLFNMYQEFATKLNQHPEDFCVAAKKLHVLKRSEFIKFVEQRKEERG
jgi:hypothetical protein